jgi:hypothetical protein
LKAYVPSVALCLLASGKAVCPVLAVPGPFVIEREGNVIIRHQLNLKVPQIPAPLGKSTRSTIKVTEPFGLDENETFPWTSAERVVVGLLHVKSGGKRNRAAIQTTPYYSYSLEIDPLVTLRGKGELGMQLRRKGDGRTKFSNALRTISREMKALAFLDIVKAQRKLDKLLKVKDGGKEEKQKKNLSKECKYIRGSYYGYHQKEPKFPEEDKLVCIALNGTNSTQRLSYWMEVNATQLEHISKQLDLPYGWRLNGQSEPVSPWAGRGDQSKMSDENASLICTKSQRGFAPAGEGLVFSVDKVLPEFRDNNTRDGNGYLRLTIRNPTDAPLSIPALRKSRNKILWKESLVCLIGRQVFLPKLQANHGILVTEQTVLEPGGQVSTTVNPLLFEKFPKDMVSSSLTFRVCLGKMIGRTTFYYNSKYHPQIIRKLKAGVPTRPVSLGD